MTEIVILGAARTPMGGMSGDLAAATASDLGAVAIKEAINRSGVKPEDISEVLMGNVLMAGQGQAPGRQAAIKAGVPDTAPASTLNKMCGSGMKTVMAAADQIFADVARGDDAPIVLAGGMESMTNAPHLLPSGRAGIRLGHGEVKDHMMLDGLEDAYNPGLAMGVFAEQCAEKYQFTREAQDAYAIESLNRAQAAQAAGAFEAEITPVEIKTRKGIVTITADEQPPKGNADKIPALRPAFQKDGTVTAANASSISDGAAAVVLTTKDEADKRGLAPVARILAQASNANAPEWFTTAPVGAIEKVLKKTGWSVDDVDLFEVNEAFAVVAMAAMKELSIPHDKINVNGGACALGHPIGASGTRILVTLISALQARGLKRGIASLCIGGGEATAIAIELV